MCQLLEPSQAQQTQPSTPSISGFTATANARPRQPQPSCIDNGTYQNKDDQTVPRPENCSTAPAGASAQCRDGSYGFSKNWRVRAPIAAARGQVVLMEKSASRLSKRRALGAWEFGRSMTNSPTARSLIGLSGLFAGLCATFALIFSILEGWQEHIQKCWPQVSATIDRYIPLRRQSAHT